MRVAEVLRLSLALVPYWEVRGHLSEGRRWLDTGLGLTHGDRPSQELRAQALLGAGRLAFWQIDFAAADGHLNASLTLSRELADRGLEADALTWLGAVRGAQGAFDEADDVLQQALRLHAVVGNAWGTAWAMWNLARAGGNRKTGSDMGHDIGAEIQVGEDCLRRFRALGDVRFVAVACMLLGNGMVLIGDFERAGALLREGLGGLQLVGERAYLLSSLFAMAEMAAHAGHPLRAARLLGAAESVSSAQGVQPAPVNRTTQAKVLTMIRPLLGGARLAAARADGRTLSLEAVVAEVWASAPLATELSSPGQGLDTRASLLSPREREVAQLLVQGCSDRIIAATLGMSLRTANAHVCSVLHKLDVRSRWQVGAQTGEYGFASPTDAAAVAADRRGT